MATKTPIVSSYAPKWPRQVFDPTVSGRPLARTLEILNEPGTYILYQDGVPYYIGQATELRSRLNQHASNPRSRLYHGWNFFSFFIVKVTLPAKNVSLSKLL